MRLTGNIIRFIRTLGKRSSISGTEPKEKTASAGTLELPRSIVPEFDNKPPNIGIGNIVNELHDMKKLCYAWEEWADEGSRAIPKGQYDTGFLTLCMANLEQSFKQIDYILNEAIKYIEETDGRS